MWACVLYALQIGVELLAYLRVYSLQGCHSLALETFPAFVSDSMKKVMPKPSTTEEFWLSVEAIFAQIASKIIEKLIRSWGFVLVDGPKHIFPAFATINQVETIDVSMYGAEHEHHMPETSFRNLQVRDRFLGSAPTDLEINLKQNWIKKGLLNWGQSYLGEVFLALRIDLR